MKTVVVIESVDDLFNVLNSARAVGDDRPIYTGDIGISESGYISINSLYMEIRTTITLASFVNKLMAVSTYGNKLVWNV